MKKNILFIAAFLFSFGLFSQTFQILNAAKEDVSNVSTIVTGDINTIIKAQLYIVNTTTDVASFKVRKVEVDIQSGTVNTFCFNYQCLPPNIFETINSMAIQPGDTTTANSFYAEYTPNDVIGASTIKYQIINANDTTDYVWVDVIYQANATAITQNILEKIEFSNPFPNPASSFVKFNYSNLPQNYIPATLEIRNLIGAVVKEVRINDTRGTINIDINDLNEGIYFYSLIVDGKVAITRKLLKN